MDPKPCAECRREFVRQAASQKYCSAACRAERASRAQRQLFGRGEFAPPADDRPPPTCLGPVCMGRKRMKKSDGFENRICAECRVVIANRQRTYSPMAFAPAADANTE
jgi:hypothetical protein